LTEARLDRDHLFPDEERLLSMATEGMTLEVADDPEELVVAADSQVEAPRHVVDAAHGQELSDRIQYRAVPCGQAQGEIHGEVAGAAAIGERANCLDEPGDVFGSEHGRSSMNLFIPELFHVQQRLVSRKASCYAVASRVLNPPAGARRPQRRQSSGGRGRTKSEAAARVVRRRASRGGSGAAVSRQ
jgi:hypothetical protein